jgi:hypothetical protein
MVFMGILMAGMFRVFAAATNSFMVMNETMAVQRSSRWGLQALQDEVLQAGFMIPVRPNPGGLQPFNPASTNQPPFLIQSTGYTPTGGTAGAVDELQMVMDVPLPISGTAAAAISVGDSSFQANIPMGAAGIQVGDAIFVMDGHYELQGVATAPGAGSNNVKISLVGNESSAFDTTYGTPLTSSAGGFANSHVVGMPFIVVRPNRVVRYTVAPRAMDPANSANLVPCLVRQEAALSPGSIMGDTAAGEQVILENVVGFNVDCSINGGKTWLRAGAGSTWANIGAAIQTAINASTSPWIRQGQGVPMWTIYTPLLFRLDLQIRTEVARSEYATANTSGTPQATYRLRRETLMLAPRNYGIGIY